MLDGPLTVEDVQSFLVAAQALLSPALLADPNNQIGSTPEAIANHFDNLRAWVVVRYESVRRQVDADGPPAPRN